MASSLTTTSRPPRATSTSSDRPTGPTPISTGSKALKLNMVAGAMVFTCSLDAFGRGRRESDRRVAVRYTGHMPAINAVEEPAVPSTGAAPALRRGLNVLRLLAGRPAPV